MRRHFAQVRWRIAEVHQHFALVQSASAPVHSRSAPVQSGSADVRWDFAVVRQSFAHVQSASAPVRCDFALVRRHFAPVQSASAPVHSAVHLPPAARAPLPERGEPDPGTCVQRTGNKSLRPRAGTSIPGNVALLLGCDAQGRSLNAPYDGAAHPPQSRKEPLPGDVRIFAYIWHCEKSLLEGSASRPVGERRTQDLTVLRLGRSSVSGSSRLELDAAVVAEPTILPRNQ